MSDLIIKLNRQRNNLIQLILLLILFLVIVFLTFDYVNKPIKIGNHPLQESRYSWLNISFVYLGPFVLWVAIFILSLISFFKYKSDFKKMNPNSNITTIKNNHMPKFSIFNKQNIVIILLIIISVFLVKVSYQLRSYLAFIHPTTGEAIPYLKGKEATDNDALYAISDDVKELKSQLERIESNIESIKDYGLKVKEGGFPL